MNKTAEELVNWLWPDLGLLLKNFNILLGFALRLLSVIWRQNNWQTFSSRLFLQFWINFNDIKYTSGVYRRLFSMWVLSKEDRLRLSFHTIQKMGQKKVPSHVSSESTDKFMFQTYVLCFFIWLKWKYLAKNWLDKYSSSFLSFLKGGGRLKSQDLNFDSDFNAVDLRFCVGIVRVEWKGDALMF